MLPAELHYSKNFNGYTDVVMPAKALSTPRIFDKGLLLKSTS